MVDVLFHRVCIIFKAVLMSGNLKLLNHVHQILGEII